MGRIVFYIAILSVVIKDVKLFDSFDSVDADTLSTADRNKEDSSEHNTKDPLVVLKLALNDDVEKAQGKANRLKQVRRNQSHYANAAVTPKLRTTDEDNYVIDPILNLIRRSNLSPKKKKSLPGKSFRRQFMGADSENSDSSESSSLEVKEWKEEWADIWHEKQLQALNQSKPGGDTVNMIYARPWGVPCGDPNQHDLPWGSCMLDIECEAEFRIYRGDYFCGRTTFVCCALQVSSYDMYQGFDVSFDKSTWEEDSYERKRNKRKKKKKKKKNKRRKDVRMKRKKKIVRTIKKVLKEMRDFLNREYRNGTRFKKKRTNQLKKFIKALKRKYVKDRTAVKNIHEFELMKVDYRLLKRLEEISKMNSQFFNNATFREIVVNGTISKDVARTLVQHYPDLKPYFHFSTPLRRSNIDTLGSEISKEESEDLDGREEYAEKKMSLDGNANHEEGYETEYGLLYY